MKYNRHQIKTEDKAVEKDNGEEASNCTLSIFEEKERLGVK